MCIKLCGITVRITPAFAVFFAFAANVFRNNVFVYSFLFALLHETVHIISLRLCGCRGAVLEFLPGGIKMHSEGFGRLSYKKTIFCTLSAPIANILTGALFYCIYILSDERGLYECAAINFLLGSINLLPMSFLDGGRAVTAFLSLYFDYCRVRRICTVLSVGAIIFLWAAFLLCFCIKKYYFFLLFFSIYCVIEVIVTDKKQ